MALTTPGPYKVITSIVCAVESLLREGAETITIQVEERGYLIEAGGNFETRFVSFGLAVDKYELRS